MTQDEIIEVAKQAGFQTGFINYMSGLGGYPFVKVIGTGEVLPNLERFAKLVTAKALAQRTWVGLTVEEIAACCRESTTTQLSFYNAIETKLKDKNT